MWTAIELVGLLMVVAFSWCVWPPLALLVGGLLLVVFAVAGEMGLLRGPERDADGEESSS